MKKILFTALAAMVVGAAGIERAAAQKFELGARAGVASQNMDFPSGISDAKAKLGWHAAVVSRIRIIGFGDGLLGAGLFFQPEVVYSQNNIGFNTPNRNIDSENGPSYIEGGAKKIRMQTVDIPLLLSLKVSLARVQAGPVFNLMNKMGGDWQMEAVRAPVGYALGASVDLLGLTIDARYHGEFKKTDLKGQDWQDIKSRFSSWSVGVGIMF